MPAVTTVRHHEQPLLRSAFLLLAICVAGVCALCGAPSFTVAVGATLAWGMIFLAFTPAKDKLDYFSPRFVITLGFLWYFVATLWYFELVPDSRGRMLETQPLWIATLVGYAAYLCGASSSARKVRRRSGREPRSLPVVSVLLFMAVMMAVTGATRFMDPGFASSLLSCVGWCVIAAPILATRCKSSFRGRRSYSLFILLVTLATMCAVLFILGSERRTLLRAVLYGCLAWHYTIRHLRLRAAVPLLAFAVCAIFFLKVEQAARSLHERPLSKLSVAELRMTYNTMMAYYGPQFAVARSYDSPPAVENFSAIVRCTPDAAGWLYGLSYAKLAVAAIPRELWPEKPVNPQNLIQGFADTAYKCPAQPLSLLGEAYWNFGWFGILFVPLAFGLVTRAAFTRGSYDNGLWRPSLFYLLWVPFVLEHFRGAFHLITIHFIITLFVVYAWVWATGLFGRKRPAPSFR